MILVLQDDCLIVAGTTGTNAYAPFRLEETFLDTETGYFMKGPLLLSGGGYIYRDGRRR